MERAYTSNQKTVQSTFFNPRLGQQIVYEYDLVNMEQVLAARAPARVPLTGCSMGLRTGCIPGCSRPRRQQQTRRSACGVQVNTTTGFVRRIKRELNPDAAGLAPHHPAAHLQGPASAPIGAEAGPRQVMEQQVCYIQVPKMEIQEHKVPTQKTIMVPQIEGEKTIMVPQVVEEEYTYTTQRPVYTTKYRTVQVPKMTYEEIQVPYQEQEFEMKEQTYHGS